MTPEERAAANALVAEAMGWVEDWWIDPDSGRKHYLVPDLFANTPDGAKAREKAEEWLESECRTYVTTRQFLNRNKVEMPWESFTVGKIAEDGGESSDRHVARALAIVAACRALKEE